MIVTLAVETEEVPDKGWLAHAPESRATTQGETREEALSNLRELLNRYPEVLDEIGAATSDRGRTLELAILPRP